MAEVDLAWVQSECRFKAVPQSSVVSANVLLGVQGGRTFILMADICDIWNAIGKKNF